MNITDIIDKHEPDAFIFPSDIEKMKHAKQSGGEIDLRYAYSISVYSSGEQSHPVYTSATVEKMLEVGIEEMAERLDQFVAKLGYFSHPDVTWQGTDEGDTVQDWNKRVFKAAVIHMLAAAPSPAKEES